jgi:hypothetical protein
MKKKKNSAVENSDEELKAEYDFSKMKGGVRGKYAKALREKNNNSPRPK